MRALDRAVVVLALSSAAACDYEEKVPAATTTATADVAADATTIDTADVATPAVVTWHGAIRPIVERRCQGCHVYGGIAPQAFDSFGATEDWRGAMVDRVTDPDPKDRMPPWPMDPACRDVRDARLLTADEKRAFVDWEAGGFPEGDPETYVAPEPATGADLGEPQLELIRPEAYAPSTLVTDDYRCFLYPQTVDADRWVRAVDVIPDQRDVVHHVLLFVVPEASVPKLEALDAQSPDKAGYPCLGGSGADGETLLSGWVPGMQPVIYPAGAAFLLPKGSRFVMQMHYNTSGVTAAVAPADATRAHLWTLPSGQEPDRLVRVRPVVDGDLAIAPGDAHAVEGVTVTSPYTETIIGVIPHMHLLGQSIRLTTRPVAAAADTCLADIPRWDFHWQQTYQYADGAEVSVRLGDTVTLRCEYDNSAGTTTVHWGEKTSDEMCLAYLVTTTPRYSDGSGTVCDGFSACMDRCPAGESLCPVDCMTWSAGGDSCLDCALEPIYSTCAEAECPVLLYSLGLCLAGCDAERLECALGECKEKLDALYGCLEEPLRDGKCDAAASACGIGPTETP